MNAIQIIRGNIRPFSPFEVQNQNAYPSCEEKVNSDIDDMRNIQSNMKISQSIFNMSYPPSFSSPLCKEIMLNIAIIFCGKNLHLLLQLPLILILINLLFCITDAPSA